MLDLTGSPYRITPGAADAIMQRVSKLHGRMELLRSQGTLTPETLRLYFGETRFKQIAESNAIEGNTLSAGETELAVLRGVTITGHDPAFVRDARSMAKALARLEDMAKVHKPADIEEVKELHGLILEDQASAGVFRNEPVAIRGSAHKPPKTWQAVMDAMEAWQSWSQHNGSLPAPLRATVLHAWLAHIHPFTDGNGRTSRAIGNLELIRAGFPSIIIRSRKDRPVYLEALSESDRGGDLALMFELVLNRLDDALRDLERAASTGQGYDQAVAAAHKAQESQLAIWNAAVQYLGELLSYQLQQRAEGLHGTADLTTIRDSLDLEDYLALCSDRSISESWTFRLKINVPCCAAYDRLAWIGYRSKSMRDHIGRDVPQAPSLFWSRRNPEKFPPWVKLTGDGAPGFEELTLAGDKWHARTQRQVSVLEPTALARAIADAIFTTLGG